MTGKFSIPKTQTYSRHPFTLSGLIRPRQARRDRQARPLLFPLEERCLLNFGSPWLFDIGANNATVAVGWRTQTAALQTASGGVRLLPAGRNTDLPWLGISQVQITLGQAATLAAGDISAIGSSGTNYGPVTVSGSGTSYTITLAQPINAADRVTITISNATIANFTRRLDVLPGDVNDDGVVNLQDMVAIRNQMLGLLEAVPTIFGDINGDGKVAINDYTAVQKLIGTHW